MKVWLINHSFGHCIFVRSLTLLYLTDSRRC